MKHTTKLLLISIIQDLGIIALVSIAVYFAVTYSEVIAPR